MMILASLTLITPAVAQEVPETATERNLREQSDRMTAATAAGQVFVEQFTASRGCEPGQEQVVNDSRSGTRATFRYRDDPRRQNRRDVQSLRFRGRGLPAIGPTARFTSDSYSERRTVCVTPR